MMKHTRDEALKVAAQKAGMIDLDGLKLADMSKVTLEDNGTVKGVDELIAALKERGETIFVSAKEGKRYERGRARRVVERARAENGARTTARADAGGQGQGPNAGRAR
jgi:hypothetical protein